MIAFSPFVLLALTISARAYFLINQDTLTIGSMDPIVAPNRVAGHLHAVVGGSNFRVEIPSSDYLRESQCTSAGIAEDKSAYWFPQMFFEYANGTFEIVNGNFVMYYLYSGQPGTTTIFPDNLRMISGNAAKAPPMGSSEQKAVSFLCLDFNGVTDPPYDFLPEKPCPSGVRAQLNFQSCWDGNNTDSPDHQSHVSYLDQGPDKGVCPPGWTTLPRIFTEMYYDTPSFNDKFGLAKNPNQPFVFSNGDATGAMYHGDFYMGWDRHTLQRVVDECNCNIYGDPQCCIDQGIMSRSTNTCTITDQIDEQITGLLPKLPGNNPVRLNGELPQPDPNPPSIRSDVQVTSNPKTKREEHPFGALRHRRFTKRFVGQNV